MSRFCFFLPMVALDLKAREYNLRNEKKALFTLLDGLGYCLREKERVCRDRDEEAVCRGDLKWWRVRPPRFRTRETSLDRFLNCVRHPKTKATHVRPLRVAPL